MQEVGHQFAAIGISHSDKVSRPVDIHGKERIKDGRDQNCSTLVRFNRSLQHTRIGRRSERAPQGFSISHGLAELPGKVYHWIVGTDFSLDHRSALRRVHIRR